MKLNDKKQKNILKILWLITDIIIFIAAMYLFVIGSNSDKIIGVIGLLVIIVEYILYKKGLILQ